MRDSYSGLASKRERKVSWLTGLGLLQQSKCSLICCSVVHIGVKPDLPLKVKDQEEKYLMYIIATLECCPLSGCSVTTD